ncbi:methyl-accepting chemotaxis protein [Marichromatium purpuratum 984]|uniref:Methyl-accepting chemotaxis protein n=1 Tax=Marichromatium purpuratum 984 TaxID=765910 RepID=W0E1T7_MARPU|nr:methyl-accepting chemotaxis protein [Marichromatium purpuratum]AHF03164.1 methyl-accepting chemotaxis protein [Marichromatium purpuratum 984]
MKLMRTLTIKQRLWLLSALVLFGIVAGVALALFEVRSILVQEKFTQVQKLVETAQSVVRHYQGLAEAGELSRAEAERDALEALRTMRYDDTNYFWVRDRRGFMLMHPIKPELVGNDGRQQTDANGKRFVVELLEQVERDGSGSVHYVWPKPGSDRPEPKLAFAQRESTWNWIVSSGIYIDDVDTAFWRHARLMGGLGTAMLLLVMALIALTSRSIIRPIGEAAQAMHRIAKGDGDLTQRLDTSGRDEITDMAVGFNEFADKTERTIGAVARATEQIAAAAEQLSTITQSNNDGIERQRGAIQQVATAVTEMTTTIKEIAKSAEDAATSAFSADESARQGGETVDGVQASNQTLTQEIAQAADAVRRFSEESVSIGGVLDVIRAIAEQTNLLALNAAIEAARAGEQGRGFAVVADEVHTLASRTQTSTTEIQQMIQNLRAVAQEAVTAIDRGEHLTRETLERAGQAHEAIAKIGDAITTIRDMNTHVASAAEEQAAAASEIDRSVIKISDFSEESAGNAQHTAAASQELAQLGETLRQLIGQFRFGTNG